MVSAADFCLNRLTRISTAVKKRRRKRKRKAKMEKRMTSLVQSLKAVRKRKASRRRTNRMLIDSNSWNGMTLPSVIDFSCSLCLCFCSRRLHCNTLHCSQGFMVFKKKKKIILASRFNQHTPQCLCSVSLVLVLFLELQLAPLFPQPCLSDWIFLHYVRNHLALFRHVISAK